MASPPPPPPIVFSELDVKLPMVMLPVRLETRYFDIDPATLELRVRIFPSPAHVTSARPGIDPAERDETIAYWRTRKAAGDTAPATDAAWQRLVQLFGDPRAQYLRRILTPTADAAGALVFPPVTLNPPPGTADILAGEAIALPSRFFVAGYVGVVRQFLTAGAAVPEKIAAGPHGEANAIKWQSDFTAAEAIGLAIRVRLPRTTAPTLTRLLVFGLREGAAAAGSRPALENLLDRHLREVGVALLPAGTPTNNTPAGRVGTPAPSTGAVPRAGSDAARMATALGTAPATFANFSGTSVATDALVAAMHAAMWPATFGYFFEPMMSPMVSAAAITRARTLFQNFVRPRGPFSVLAMGNQPYGVLPVSSLGRWRTPQGADDPVANVLNACTMYPIGSVERDKLLQARANLDPVTRLNGFLSRSPISVRWLARTVQSSLIAAFDMVGGQVPFDRFASLVQQMYNRRTAEQVNLLGLSGSPFLLDLLFDSTTYRLNHPLVAPPEASRSAALAANYISAIAAADVDTLKNHGVAGASPQTLLYLILRQAALLVMGRIANLYRPGGPAPTAEPVFVEDPASTVWARLTTPVAALENRPLTEVFKAPLPNVPEMTELVQHRNALKTLSTVPVGDLERLTAEALDASSYRVDAWITAMATERLADMRKTTPLGAHLGAYAWLDAPPVPTVLSKDGAPLIVDPDSEGYIHAPRLDQARTAAILRAGYIARHQESAEAPLTIDISSDRVRDARMLIEAIHNGASLAALLGERIERWMIEAGAGAQLATVRGQFSLVDGSGRARIDGVKAAQAWSVTLPATLPTVAARLAAVTDALGDLLLAEAVHQQSSGNPGRAQTALSALDTGIALPSEFDVVRTTSNSTSTTWRIVLPLPQAALDAWIRGLIGSAAALSATVTPTGKPPVVVTLAQAGVTANGLLDYVKTGVEASALSTLLADKAGGGVVVYSPALQTALEAAYAVSQMLKGSHPLQDGDVGPGRTPVPGFDRKSLLKEWLHDLAKVRPAVDALDRLDFVLRKSGQSLKLQFVSAGPGLNIIFIGDLPAGPLTGLVIDAWNETTPGTDATSGIAMHYDAPRSRAPQAILLMVPPDPTRWSIDAVESILLETARLAEIRMVAPSNLYGSFVPGLYVADNLAGDTVATNFSSAGTVLNFKNP